MQEQPATRISIRPIDPSLSTLDHALAYARDGLRVIFVHAPIFGDSREPSEQFPTATACTCGKKTCPEKTRGKHPIATSWTKIASSEEQVLRDQLSHLRIEDPNVGIAFGEQSSGAYLVAIDIDDEDRYQHLAKELGELPTTARCNSGNGYRLLYELPPEISSSDVQNVTGIGGERGVDAKAEGGQVVVAPSWHYSGKRYEWVKYGSIECLPITWALELLKREPPKWIHKYTPQSIREDSKAKKRAEKYLEHAVMGDAAALAACGQGARNSMLYKRAVALFSLCGGLYLGSHWSYVQGELVRAAKAAGLSESEVRRTISSAEKFVRESGAIRIPVVLADPPTSPGTPPPPDGSSPSVPVQTTSQPQRPVIRMTTELHDDVKAAIESLRTDPNLYQREGQLVHITRVTYEEVEKSTDVQVDDGTRKSLIEGSPQIRPISLATLRKKMTSVAIYQKFSEKASTWRPSLPTDPIVADVYSCGEWSTIRPLIGVTEAPTMRPDGSIVQEAGYDRVTRYLYEPSTKFGIVQPSPSQEDARAAYAALSEPFEDFPYLNASHRAVPVAAILTLIARPAIQGAVPGFLFDASTRGSGKTLQTDAIAIVATGRGAPRMNFPNNEDEMEKILGAYALRGAPFFSLDNVPSHRPFGGGPLDRVLTARDTVDLRVLGRSEVPTMEWRAMIMATGNNIQIYADTARRVLIARLEPKDEHPEKRTNFKHEDLLGWIRKERPRLVVAALTLLRAWVVAGRPKMRCARWGSFEEWSAFLPHAIMFAGGADPMLARPASDEEVDSQTRAYAYVLSTIHEMGLKDFKVGAFLKTLYRPKTKEEIESGADDGLGELRESIETLCPPKFGRPPDAVAVANRLRTFKGRYINGKRLVSKPGSGGTDLWSVESMANHVSST